MGLFRRAGCASHDGDPQHRTSLVELLGGHIGRNIYYWAELREVTPEEIEALLGLILRDVVVEFRICSAAGGVRLATPRAASRD